MMDADAPLGDPPTVVRLEHTQAHTILPNRLYLGPAHSATNEAAVHADAITHILNVTQEIPKQQFSSGVHVCQLACYDSPQQILPFESAASFIKTCLKEKGTRCLVHCNAGQSRSASIIIYYLMTQGHSLKEAYDHVKTRKPDIRPNFGFCSQLQKADMEIFGKQSSLDMDEYKADTLCEILEGSGRTRDDVLRALKQSNGDGEIALEILLE